MITTQVKPSFLFYMLTLSLCLNFFFLGPAAAQVNITPIDGPDDSAYTFESIDVTGFNHLALTASNDLGGYAGYTRLADGGKEVAFTIIDGVFTIYDFPGSKNTYFYAINNNGRAAGHYEDSDGLHHGVVLEEGKLRQYDYPDAIQTEIYGIIDADEVLIGNFIDASGVRRGFSGDLIIEPPGATATYANSVSATGAVAGSYVDAAGVYHPYVLFPTGDLVNAQFSINTEDTDFSGIANLEYFFVHGLTDGGGAVARGKAVEDVPRTYAGQLGVLHEVQFPGSVSTEGWNINRDDSVVGYYDTADGRRHGFHARLVSDSASVAASTGFTYTFESIDVPGVDFLEVTASSDFEDYAGNTKSIDGKKIVGFTLIDGVFTTYDFPGSKNTYFYALGNNGQAAGHYEASDGLFHGVVLEDGKLRQYDFPGAVQTFLRGISDATGVLTGDFIDASGIRRGFSGDLIIEVPGAPITYADFINAEGVIVGSSVDAEGIYSTYVRIPNGNFVTLPGAPHLEYFYHHGINDAGLLVSRFKAVGDVPRTAVGTFAVQEEVKFPGSVSTEGWNINQDGSIVGSYVSADGRRHGFIARPATEAVSDYFGNAYHVTLAKGLNMISVPLAPPTPLNAKTLAGLTGATTVIAFDETNQQFVGWTPSAPDHGFPIEGGKGYIVNVPQARQFAYVGSRWTNQTEGAAAAPAITTEPSQQQGAWAFVVSGHLEGKSVFDGYKVIVRNTRTNSVITTSIVGSVLRIGMGAMRLGNRLPVVSIFMS